MTKAETTALETRLAAMSDTEVAAFYQSLEVDDPQVDVVAGAMELRNLDD